MLSLSETLSNSILDFPLELGTGDFRTSLSAKFDSYYQFLEVLNTQSSQGVFFRETLESGKVIGDSILQVLDRYLQGAPAMAYEELRGLMAKVDGDFEHLRLFDRSIDQLPFSNLFRFRVSPSIRLSRKEIFHVPFSDRRKVGSYRFSIPGLPALYLSTSTYACWEEMGRPYLDDIHVSRFELVAEPKYNFINLSVTNRKLLGWLSGQDERRLLSVDSGGLLLEGVANYLILWPLLAACHIKVRSHIEPFRPEYILPQLITQYVGESAKIDGIAYSSTRCEAEHLDSKRILNLVLPAKSAKNGQQYCSDLTEKVLLTAPLSLRFFRTAIRNGLGTTAEDDFVLQDGVTVRYDQSEFGYIEQQLAKLTASKIDSESG